uniref:Uncharacterized protein n=1 Tax=Bubo bubo TaxID=30461 RepID=A0A8C0FRH2_BUBBB
MLISSKLSFRGKNCGEYHRSYRRDNMYNIRSIICHLACYGKVKNISDLIYVKICGVLKVFRENMIQVGKKSNQTQVKYQSKHLYFFLPQSENET